MITLIALAAPFVLYAICYWLQSLREKTPTDPIVLKENPVGQKGTLKGVTNVSTQRNRRKRKRKKK